MTITLHWWLVPIVLIIIGCIFMQQAKGFDFFLAFIGFGFWAGALFFCLGHWLA